MTARRDPKLPGVSGVTAADVEALASGRLTLQDLATRVGTSKQAVSRKIQSMRAPAPTGPSIPPSATAAPPRSTGASIPALAPISTSTGPTIPAGAVLIDVQQAIISVNLAVISRAAGLLESGDVLGPSAVKALGAAVSVARAELTALGVLAPDDEDTALSTLTVRTMSDTEHDQAKAAAEEMNGFD